MAKNDEPSRYNLERNLDKNFLNKQSRKQKGPEDGFLASLRRMIEARRVANRAEIDYVKKHPTDEIDTSILEKAKRDVEEAKRAGGGEKKG